MKSRFIYHPYVIVNLHLEILLKVNAGIMKIKPTESNKFAANQSCGL